MVLCVGWVGPPLVSPGLSHAAASAGQRAGLGSPRCPHSSLVVMLALGILQQRGQYPRPHTVVLG